VGGAASPLPPPPQHEQDRHQRRAALAAAQIAAGSAAEPGVIDIFDALGGANLTQPGITCDGCHPTDKGYTEIAHTIYAVRAGAGAGGGVRAGPPPPLCRSSLSCGPLRSPAGPRSTAQPRPSRCARSARGSACPFLHTHAHTHAWGVQAAMPNPEWLKVRPPARAPTPTPPGGWSVREV